MIVSSLLMVQIFALLWDIQSDITVTNSKKALTDMRLVCVSRQVTFAGGVGLTHLEIGTTT